MAKQDVVTAQLQAIQQGEQDVLSNALGAAYDAGEQNGNGPGFTQADIDNAVKSATDPLNAQIASDAQALSDAQNKASSDLAVVQQQLADMTTKEQGEEQVVLNLQNAVNQVQASLDAIKNLVLGSPAPAPSSPPPSDV